MEFQVAKVMLAFIVLFGRYRAAIYSFVYAFLYIYIRRTTSYAFVLVRLQRAVGNFGQFQGKRSIEASLQFISHCVSN